MNYRKSTIQTSPQLTGVLAILIMFVLLPTCLNAQASEVETKKQQSNEQTEPAEQTESADESPTTDSTVTPAASVESVNTEKEKPSATDDEPEETERQKELRAAAEKERKERGGTIKDLKTKLKEAAARKTKKALNLTFDDLVFEMTKKQDFKRDMLTSEHNQLNKRRVSLSGYIRPSSKQSGITKFVFVRDNLECCFGPGAALFDCVLVKLEKGQSADYTVRPVTIEGDFYIKEFIGPNGKVWAVYRMKNGRVK